MSSKQNIYNKAEINRHFILVRFFLVHPILYLVAEINRCFAVNAVIKFLKYQFCLRRLYTIDILFTQYTKKGNHLKVLFKKVCSENFHGCQVRFLIQKFQGANLQLFFKKYSITIISPFFKKTFFRTALLQTKMIPKLAKVLNQHYFWKTFFMSA